MTDAVRSTTSLEEEPESRLLHRRVIDESWDWTVIRSARITKSLRHTGVGRHSQPMEMKANVTGKTDSSGIVSTWRDGLLDVDHTEALGKVVRGALGRKGRRRLHLKGG
jgi:hypothetical protein